MLSLSVPGPTPVRHLTYLYRAVVPGCLEQHSTRITDMHSTLHPAFLCVLRSFNRVVNVLTL